MTGVALVAIIALAAGGVVVVFLAIAHVESIEDTEKTGDDGQIVPSEWGRRIGTDLGSTVADPKTLEASAPSPRQQVTGQTGGVMPWAPVDSPTPRVMPEPLTATAQKSRRRAAWHDTRHAWKVYRHRHADELRRRAGWVALVVSSAVFAYLITHL